MQKATNTQEQSQLVSLSTRFATMKDSSLSDVSWSMQTTIGAKNDNFAPVISVESMVCFNTIQNINKFNNVLKIITVYKVSGVFTETIQTVTVPVGHYDLQSLLDYLNTAGVCQATGEYTAGAYGTKTYYTGLGGQNTPSTAGTVIVNEDYPAFVIDTNDTSRVKWQTPIAGGGAGNNLGKYYEEFEYVAFGLVADVTTIPLMAILGLVDYEVGQPTTNMSPIFGSTSNAIGLSTRVFHGTTVDTSYYDFTIPIPASIQDGTSTALLNQFSALVNMVDLSSASALTISWEFVSSNIRNSYSDLTTSSVIAVVPISAAFGVKNVYMPPVPYRTLAPYRHFNEFHIVVRSADTGKRVDFQGVPWLLNIRIDFEEIINNPYGELATSGVHQQTMPLYNHEQFNHNMPNSGVKKKRKT